jgi:tetratricopeptide (TPR) repeat protein
MAPTEPGGRAIEAAVLYTIHDFSGALAVGEALFRDDPSQVGALATIADSKLELGRIDDARSDFDLLATLARGPSVDVRLARLASVTGRPDEALRLAIAARDAAETNSAMAAVDVGFYEYAVGEYARLAGKAATARSAYQAALAIRDTDFGALVGLARIDAFDGRLGEALAGLRKAAAIAPQPETVALLGDLLAASGDATGAKEQYSTVRFIERLGQIQSTVFDRVLIRFELDHAGASEDELAAARASLAARPDTTGHDAVAWALYRLGRLDEAAVEIKAARVNGADDARLRFHDGAIALARGDRAAGQALLRSALASGPALDPIERAEATHLSTR